jgi:hypothetical protein
MLYQKRTRRFLQGSREALALIIVVNVFVGNINCHLSQAYHSMGNREALTQGMTTASRIDSFLFTIRNVLHTHNRASAQHRSFTAFYFLHMASLFYI